MVSTDLLTGWRTRLRALPVFDTEPPVFDAATVPDNPLELVGEWLELAGFPTRLEYTRPGADRWSHGMLAE